MPSNTLDTTLTEISSVTRKYFVNDVADQITLANPVLMKLKGNIKSIDGGDDIRVPVEVAFNTSASYYQGNEQLDVSNNDVLFALIFNWKQWNVAISIPKLNVLKNQGASKVIDILDAKTKNAKKSLDNLFGTGIYSAGTTSNQITGARTWLSTSNTYGGVSQTSESWLQAGSVDSTTTALSLAAMQTVYEAASQAPEKPNLISTTAAEYSAYHGLLTPIQRFTDAKTASGGFENILFRGTPVLVDRYCPSGFMVMWNLDYVELRCAASRKYPGEFIDFVMPHNQDVAVAHVRGMGELTCRAPRFQGALSALAD